MTLDQVNGIARAILAAVGGYLVSKGTVSADQLTAISGAVLPVIAAVWSFIAKKQPTA